ncbi:hypothetical protein KXJ69_10525 [Aureisphaera sp. CAU 1614]|uniref:Uncharacterized protein n=1 Tax=Halomarinibacterium sedimenti TaxID=2857106 RepID=A0A9X1FPY3_9FLAO|nr:hypothetical protein [Halomarinibacterium sedimenti]MBW2938544.1 hypothetical protein [Halomarinibacterium sedimenti]
MKIFRYIIIVVALALLIYNATKLNFESLFVGDSKVAIICILASACAILLMVILNISYRIKGNRKV